MAKRGPTVNVLPPFRDIFQSSEQKTVMNIISCIFCKCQLPSAGSTHDKYVEHLQVVEIDVVDELDSNSTFRDGI